MSKHKSLKVGSSKHSVHLCEGATGTGEKLFAYSYRSLAELFGVREGTIRQWVNLGKLDPMDLQSVAGLYHAQRSYEHTTAQRSRRLGTAEECELPPEGWECSRVKGHDGPCAASMCDLCYKPNVVCPRHQPKYTPKCLCGHAEWCSVCTSY